MLKSQWQLKEQLAEEWGPDYGVNVVPISNFNTLQLRSLIKDIGKFYGVPFAEVNKVTGCDDERSNT
jgi:DNA polymerase III alpha subunit